MSEPARSSSDCFCSLPSRMNESIRQYRMTRKATGKESEEVRRRISSYS